jgi:uncharacterized surface anchored protein
MLYKGYVGTKYTDWGLECDDDLYYATKVAVHCFADGTTPTTKYEIAHRVGLYDNVSLEEVQRRSAKVLQVAQSIYDYAYSSSDNYIKANISVTAGSQTETTLSGTQYLIQNYTVTANKELSSYGVSILGFPDGTKILNSSNNVATTMTNSTFKIAIPTANITSNFTGNINIDDAKVKSFPIFYADSGNNSTQNYVIADPSEITNARTTLFVDAYKSTLKIVKTDDENKAVAGAVFNLKYENGTEIGDYTTDSNGNITVSKLKQGTIIATEKSVPSAYILDSSSKTVILGYNSTATLNVSNNLKKGNIKIIKLDQDNNEIRISDVTFQLLDSNKKLVNTYTTDENGEIFINDLKCGDYYLRETKENSLYYPLDEDIKVTVEWNKTTTQTVENEKLKGQIEIIKVDEDYNEIKIEGAEFQIIDSNDTVVETIKTGQNGYAITSRLPIRRISYKRNIYK